MTQEIADLLKKYKEHTLTEEEYERLRKWLSESEENRQYMQRFVNLYKASSRLDALHYANPKEAWEHISSIYRLHHRRLVLRRSVLAAACVLILFVGGGVVYKIMNSSETSLVSNVANDNIKQYPAPSSQKKNLQNTAINVPVSTSSLMSGKKIQSNSTGSYTAQLLTSSKADSINKQPVKSDNQVKYNKDVIPCGQEKLVHLPDGTTVYMNAASTLTYPVVFDGKQRVVTLQGEAYFDVKKDPAHPFVVETKFGNVTVLGTAFDVNAYNDLGKCYTTLLRGKVRLTTTNDEAVVLTPGQQAVISAGQVWRRDVNVEDYVSWMTGVYKFEDTTLGEIMDIMERWYGVHIVFKDRDVADITYSGVVARYKDVNTFLNIFESMGDLTYRINQRTIYIYKK